MNRPHAPRYAPDKYFDLFPLNEVQLPPYRADDLEDVPTILWQNPDGSRTWQANWLPKLLAAGGEEWWRRSVRSYLACVAFVDDQIGTILDALDNGPHANNTLVVVFSDHGFHLGEKDHLKKTTIWEEVTRVPLIFAGPGVQAGADCRLPVSLVDIYPTLVDAAGLPPAETDRLLDGHSLVPLLRSAEGSWEGPDLALSVLHGNQDIPPNQPAPRRDQHFSVRSLRYRYTLCADGSEELYDLEQDPHCWYNQSNNKHFAAIKAELRRGLEQLVFADE